MNIRVIPAVLALTALAGCGGAATSSSPAATSIASPTATAVTPTPTPTPTAAPVAEQCITNSPAVVGVDRTPIVVVYTGVGAVAQCQKDLPTTKGGSIITTMPTTPLACTYHVGTVTARIYGTSAAQYVCQYEPKS